MGLNENYPGPGQFPHLSEYFQKNGYPPFEAAFAEDAEEPPSKLTSLEDAEKQFATLVDQSGGFSVFSAYSESDLIRVDDVLKLINVDAEAEETMRILFHCYTTVYNNYVKMGEIREILKYGGSHESTAWHTGDS